MRAEQSSRIRNPSLLGMLALVLLASGTLTPVAQDVEAGSLAGRVVDEASGKPLQGATVTLTFYFSVRPVTTRTETTANDGSFTFASIPPGDYRVSVTKDHYLRQEYGQRALGWESKLIAIQPGKHVNAINFQLGRKGAISGTVWDHNGSAVSDNKMLLYARGSATDGNWEMYPVGTTRNGEVKTDLLGRYQFVDLEPNDYFVVATRKTNTLFGSIGALNLTTFGTADIGDIGGKPCNPTAPSPNPAAALQLANGGNVPANSPQQGQFNLPMIYPGTHDPTQAMAVHISANADIQGIDFKFRPTPAGKLGGTITLPEDPAKPSAGTPFCVNVGLYPAGPGREYRSGQWNTPLITLQESKTFQFNDIIPGMYKIVAVSEVSGRRMVAFQNIEVQPGGSQTMALALKPTIDLTGRMIANSPTPQDFSLGKIRVGLIQKSETSILNLFFLSGFNDGTANFAMVDPDGSFVLHGILPEVTYSLGYSGLEQAGVRSYLTSIRYGDSETPSRGIIAVKKEPEELTLHFDHIPGRIEAVVMDQGRPLPGVSTVLARQGQYDLISAPYKSSDEQGHVVFENVTPGDYEIYAWGIVMYQSWNSRSFVEQFKGRSQSVHVEKGGVSKVNVQAIMLERAN